MTPALEVLIGAKITDLTRRLDAASGDVREFERDVNKSTDKIDKDFNESGKNIEKFGGTANAVFKGVAAGMAAAFSVGAIVNFGRQVVDITGQFQKLRAVLSNTLGSQGIADLRLEQIQEFAAQTPFGVTELTEAFVKLSNQGFTPTIKQMRQLGDLASSTGKSFDQLAEAIIDAQVGEYERLKEFGVRAKDAGDSVIFTFKGVATEVEKTSSAIREYLSGLGDAEGVTGSMVAISKTLEGQLSNTQDNYDALLVSIGNNTQGAFSTAIGWVNAFIVKLRELNEEIEIREKFDIGGDFLERMNRALNPFSDKTLTDAEKQVIAIQSTEKVLGEFIEGINTGAKSVQDYAKGIAKLTTAYNDLRVAGQIPESSKGIAQEYREAIQTLSDLQKKFVEGEGATPDANFGSGGKSEAEKAAERLTAALQKHNDQRRLNEVEGREKAKVELELYYRDLLDLAKGNNEATLQLQNDFRSDMDALNKDWDKKEEDARIQGEEALQKKRNQIAENGIKIVQKLREDDLKDQLQKFEKAAKEMAEMQAYYAQQMGNAIGNALEDSLADGENIFQALGREFKRMIIRMIADAVALKAANIFQGLMSGASSGKSGSNWAGWIGTALNVASKFLGSSGGGGGASASMSTMSMPVASSGFSGLDLSANSFSSGAPMSGLGGIPIYVSGEFVQRGKDLHAVIKSAEQDSIRFYGK